MDAEPLAATRSTPPELGDAPAWPPAPAVPTVPGGYVAPAIVPTAAATIDGRPATATSIAAASIAEGTVKSVPAAPRPERWFSVPAQTKDASDGAPGKAGLFSDLPFRTPQDAPSWAVAIGGLFSVLAFILPLPWAANGVIGTQGDQTITGQWGLANTANLVPWAVSIALLLMTLIPSRIPRSISGVVLPILVGGWLLGIVWIYATTAFGLGWGVDALAIGGVLLVIGGAVGHWRADAAAAGPDKDSDAA